MKILYNYIENDELKNNAYHSYEVIDGIINITKKSDPEFKLEVLKLNNRFFIETNDIELRNEIFKKNCEEYLEMLKNDIKFIVNGYQIFSNNLKIFKNQINYGKI